jgi:pimeloyl-ACP methyl ester carboxylesterase
VPLPPRRRAPLRRTAAATACAVLATATLGSCALFDSDEPELSAVPLESPSGTDPGAAVDPALARYYEQALDWSGCRESMECAELDVPLDYADPDGESISVSLLRVPASDDDQRIGSLVVNPGGPGGSGVDYAARGEVFFGAEVRAAFDVVGFDPRGVARSTPIDCLTDAELDTMVASDPDPETLREARRSDALIREFGQGCLERSGDLTRHVSTEEAARDMDVLRSALGEERLTYFGASYGTFLGATYADLFPTRVGRMVFDGAVDPSLGSVETSLVQA